MPNRDGKIPSDADLDALAEITADDIDDAVRTFKRRVPSAAPAVDAERKDSGARGPIADSE